ncbi:hypothetical protein EV189_2129 [Motilibacter rhizosphaerae]|uniref:YCII-related domain-containing protein n=1 Tax=Motilibacter rhizosphaerae TaxID=598652 RepID=A0A4Q7NTK0_9ACTN|nr:YciI family protein [Motilibacter rhizosphaerae]RZS90344.1 hypothetical protein EV189_2129 [Motilibacter rhizosphaerae]
MAQYLVLIYDSEAAWAAADDQARKEVRTQHQAFQDTAGARNLGGNALQPAGTATSLRRDGSGGVSVTDGPFVETKEVLGGYYLLEAADLDEAVALAHQVPTLGGGVEVRPVQVIDW